MPDNAGVSPSKQELATALDAATGRALPLIYLGVGTFYLVLVAVAPFLPGDGVPPAELIARWAGTAAFALLAGWFLNRRHAPPGWGNHLAGILGVVTVLNSLFLVTLGGPKFVFAVVASLLAFALFLLSVAWVTGLAVLALGLWVYIMAADGVLVGETARTINLLAIGAVSIIVQVMRVSLHKRLERLKANDIARLRQEHDLARERALSEQRRRIVRMTAHELGTPMTPVLLQAHLLAKGELSPEQRRNLELLQRNLDRLQETVGTIVAAAQADEKADMFYTGAATEGT